MEPNQQPTNPSVPEPMMPPTAPAPEPMASTPPETPEVSTPPLTPAPEPTVPPVSTDPMASQPMSQDTPAPAAMPVPQAAPTKAKKGLPKGALIAVGVLVIIVIALVIWAATK